MIILGNTQKCVVFFVVSLLAIISSMLLLLLRLSQHHNTQTKKGENRLRHFLLKLFDQKVKKAAEKSRARFDQKVKRSRGEATACHVWPQRVIAVTAVTANASDFNGSSQTRQIFNGSSQTRHRKRL